MLCGMCKNAERGPVDADFLWRWKKKDFEKKEELIVGDTDGKSFSHKTVFDLLMFQ